MNFGLVLLLSSQTKGHMLKTSYNTENDVQVRFSSNFLQNGGIPYLLNLNQNVEVGEKNTLSHVNLKDRDIGKPRVFTTF